MNVDDLWVGWSPSLGFVLFDPYVNSSRIDKAGSVRLWTAHPEGYRILPRDEARRGLMSLARYTTLPQNNSNPAPSPQFLQGQYRSWQKLDLPPEDELVIDPDEEDARRELHQDIDEEREGWALERDTGWYYPD